MRTPVAVLAALTGLAVLTSCGGSDGGTSPVPPKPFALTLSSSPTSAAEALTKGANEPFMQCHFQIDANATGDAGATWKSAAFRYYAGEARVPIDSLKLSAAEIADAWNDSRIEGGEHWASYWRLEASMPYTVTATLEYLVDGEDTPRQSETSMVCGPFLAGSAPPPTAEIVSVTPSTELEPGDPLTVEYSMQSDIGLWQSSVVLSGACEKTVSNPEMLEESASRTVRISLPLECRNQEPLTVTVVVLDGANREVQRVAGPILVADRTAPQLSAFLAAAGYSQNITSVNYDLFVGEPLELFVLSSDNVGLKKLLWGSAATGFVDSVSLNGQSASHVATMFVRPEWSGATQLAVRARDVSGLETEVTSPLGGFRVYPTVDRPMSSINVSGYVSDFVIDAKRGALYLVQPYDSRVTVVSMASSSITRTITFSGQPQDADLSASGDSLVVIVGGTSALTFVNLNAPAAAPTVMPLTLDKTVNQMPMTLRVTASGKAMVIVSGFAPSSRRLVEVDIRTGAQRFRSEPGFSGVLSGATLERSHDRSKLVVEGGSGTYQMYDDATDTFGSLNSLSDYNARPSLSFNGSRTAAELKVYGPSLEFVSFARRLQQPFDQVTTALSPDAQYLYASYSGIYPVDGIIRYRVSDGQIIDRTTGTMRPNLMRASADGTWLVYVHRESPASVGWVDFR